MARHRGEPLPREVDTVIVGAGTCGVAVAARLIERTDRSVLLVEAGPDWGPFAEGGWPAELLDPTVMPVDRYQWGYVSAAWTGLPGLPLERGRLMGGCSSHNGCAAVWGHRRDYDDWAAAGNPGWGAGAMLPLLREADERLHVYQPAPDEVSPWHRACLETAPAVGLPILPTLNDLDAELGIAIHSINIRDRMRWNAAFAYLDPVRGHPRLHIAAETLVDRLLFDGPRCTGLDVIGPDGPARVACRSVVLCGGAYGTPLILLRSGVGPADDVRAHGIAPVLDLAGVGRNLQDHPAYPVHFSGSDRLTRAMEAFGGDGGLLREEGTTVLARSRHCRGPFDLHLYPVGTRSVGDRGWRFAIAAAVMEPRSRGTVRLGGRDPEAQPVIDTAYFSDPDGYDLEALLDGIDLIRGFASRRPLTELAGDELQPGPDVRNRDTLRDIVRRTGTHDYHPAGTCKMGPASDPLAVVNADGVVHGLEGVAVADISIAPTVPRANTNVPALVVGLRIADRLISTARGRSLVP
jgi:choline dehydrogenase